MPFHQHLGEPVGPCCLTRLQRPSGSFCFHKVERENTLVITSGAIGRELYPYILPQHHWSNFEVSNTGQWIAKSLAISSVIGLMTWAGFYLFFRVHQELYVQPAYAFKLWSDCICANEIVALIYFRTRSRRSMRRQFVNEPQKPEFISQPGVPVGRLCVGLCGSHPVLYRSGRSAYADSLVFFSTIRTRAGLHFCWVLWRAARSCSIWEQKIRIRPGRSSSACPFVSQAMFSIRRIQSFQRDGIWALTKGPGNGIPYKVYCVQAGKYSGLWLFLLVSLLARSGAFCLVLADCRRHGLTLSQEHTSPADGYSSCTRLHLDHRLRVVLEQDLSARVSKRDTL